MMIVVEEGWRGGQSKCVDVKHAIHEMAIFLLP